MAVSRQTSSQFLWHMLFKGFYDHNRSFEDAFVHIVKVVHFEMVFTQSKIFFTAALNAQKEFSGCWSARFCRQSIFETFSGNLILQFIIYSSVFSAVPFTDRHKDTDTWTHSRTTHHLKCLCEFWRRNFRHEHHTTMPLTSFFEHRVIFDENPLERELSVAKAYSQN